MRWSRYEMLWVRDGLLGTSWSGYEMVWVRIGLGTNWSAGYELTRSHLSSDIISSFLQIATETQLAERARLEQRIEDLEVSIRVVSWCTFCRLKNSEQSNPIHALHLNVQRHKNHTGWHHLIPDEIFPADSIFYFSPNRLRITRRIQKYVQGHYKNWSMTLRTNSRTPTTLCRRSARKEHGINRPPLRWGC